MNAQQKAEAVFTAIADAMYENDAFILHAVEGEIAVSIFTDYGLARFSTSDLGKYQSQESRNEQAERPNKNS